METTRTRTVTTVERTQIVVSWDDIRAALHAKGLHIPKEPTFLRAVCDANDRFEAISIEFAVSNTSTVPVED